MVYEYKCNECDHAFDVIKSYKDIDKTEHCEKCSGIARRLLPSRQSIDSTAAADWNKRSWNPAFGEALTPKEAKQEAKRRNWTEVGDEPAHKIEKHFKDQREKNYKNSWDKLNLDLGDVK